MVKTLKNPLQNPYIISVIYLWHSCSWIFFLYLLKARSQLAFYVNLHRTVIGPSATLTGRWRPDIDLRRMLTGFRSFMGFLYINQDMNTNVRLKVLKKYLQSTLVISNSLISNNRLSRRENLVPVLTRRSTNRQQNIVEKEQFLLFSTIFSIYL